ncbi:PREDICTED: probable LRR receptor-like serine/threonine-protein kinase At3g47570 [Fragaria vesca subsp. vesca]|uniref:probable LRR receptor-like serine/threonine-protein kinase At3g47570 n=1 Tax=Fragaria vesca subsp. vesca TaxID=101020 RepID=UPI0002C3643E|nr:PREDICTED: probable LRR receptor-like serine/threonine-protein kinase At3g47570 [Fragaria vesca subsp. vesca]
MEMFEYLHVLTLLLFINVLQPTTVVSSFGNETDHSALLKFKESIVADPHGVLNSWNDSVHFCKWGGITCGRRHQRVTGLNLSDADLNGTISPYIGNLSFLRLISLPRNKFSGIIPQQVGQLFRLRRLDLDTNMLKGGIPVNLTFCPELSVINIAENRLKGYIPSEIGSLTKLVYLDLARNNLTGRVPPSLGNLSSLEQLALGENNLVGTVPEELGQLRNLWRIGISYGNLSGMLPPSLFNMSSMQVFSFTGNKFEGIVPLPPSIDRNMPHLHKMFLGKNEFSGQIPASFGNASQLRELDVLSNNFVGQVPTSFRVLSNLQWLSLGENNLGSNSSNDLECITFLTNCSNLKLLGLDSNNFGGVLPNSVANFSTNLTQLYLGGNQIVGTIPETLGNLNSLIFFGLEDNLFTGIIPSSFGKLQNLQILALPANRLSGWIPSSLGNLTKLFELDIFENELEGSIPPTIGYCKNLQIMDISQNRLSGDIPPEIIGLSSLLFLDLSQNSLTGSMPVEVSNLKNIYHLDISGNNLTGEITETIGECQSLEFLHLQDNLIQGRIPYPLTSLKGLQYVDLSKNNLSSQIPKNLQRLPFLIYLNLSFNNLEGEVPKEGVFRNISAISLDGNTKLCGGVSALRLPACPINVLKKKKFNGLKLYFTISLVVGCSLLFAIISALYWRKKTQNTKQLSAVPSINFLSRVSYQTLHQATGGFSLSNQIGSGSVGSVYKGILDEQENSVVAIKVLNLQQKGAFKSFVAECNALRNIRHKNLVKILTCCSSTDHDGNDFKALVFEYMSNGSLEEWLHSENQSRSLNLLQRLNIAVDVASALCYLHDHCEPQIIHRDMKPSNVLLDDDMVACVSDFGLARLIPATADSSENLSSTVGINGTIGYAAPEYAVGVEPSTQGDVYSYGILVLQLFTGRRPTDQIFVDGDNIHTFVKTAIQGRIMQIVDPALIATREEETATSTTNNEGTKIDDHNNEIIVDEENVDSESLSKMNTYLWKCILPTLKIGVACSEESPRNRMSMEEVLRELHRIKNAYNAIDIRQERPRRS